MSNIFPVMIAPRWKQAFVAAAIAPNLLCGTLGAPPPAKPFANTDWQLPRTAARIDASWSTLVVVIPPVPFAPLASSAQTALVRFDRSWSTNLLESTLAPAIAAAPFIQSDWPSPRRPFYSPILRTWLQGTPTNLLGQDRMFGGPGQPLENADWPLWRTARRAIGEGQSPSLAMLSVVPPAPFTYVDGRVPRAAVYPISLRTWNSSLSLLGQDTFFGGPGQPPANLDSRTPKGAPAISQSWSVNLLETTLTPIAAAPFVGIDRQIFAVPAFDRSWSNNLLESTLAQIAAPFGSPDWRLPTSVGRLTPAWTQNLLLTTLFVAPPMPLNLFDTRLPVLRPRGVQNWVSQALNFTPPPIVLPLTSVNAARDLEALGKDRLIITFNGSRLIS